MKVFTVVGARPQFIKAAVLSRLLERREGVHEVLVHTGQHYDDNMSSVFFDELSIPAPDYHLGVGSGSHGAQTGRMLEEVERVMIDERPDVVVVYGDTNSTLAGALAASKLNIPVAHVEAGLRSFNTRMPEEINRVLTDRLSQYLFVPTEDAVRHLQNEGMDQSCIYHVGDIMYDAVLLYSERATRSATVLNDTGLDRSEYVLATVHRAESTDSPTRLAAIFRGLMEVADHIPVVLPLHPRTEKALAAERLLALVRRKLHVLNPVGYLDMMQLEKHAALVATDSGGVQKEAYFHQVPCVTLRDETEWTELTSTGWNSLVSPTSSSVVADAVLSRMGSRGDDTALYGDGTAAETIADILTSKKKQG